MKKHIFLLVFIIIFLLPSAALAGVIGHFNDVPKTAWFYNDVLYSYENGVFMGTSNHEFSPKTPVTRGMFVAVLYRQAGSPQLDASGEEQGCVFKDVKESDYYYKAVIWANANKITNGVTEDLFDPSAEITREQACRMLFYYNGVFRENAAADANPDFSRFKDGNSVSDWAREAMDWCIKQGLISGRGESDGNYLAPGDNLLRSEAAAVLNRFAVKFDGKTIKDYSDKIDFSAINSYGNTKQEYWFGTDYDSLNRPLEPLRFQREEGSRHNALAIDSSKSDKVIYLTFDEGYEAGYTGKILNVLAAKNVPSVFFITGDYYRSDKALVERMIKEGHIVGNHSDSHPAAGMQSLSVENQYKDINKLQNYLRNDFGYEMTLFRFPAGIYSDRSLALMDAMHMKSVFWSFAYYDYDTGHQMSASQALSKLKARLHPGAVFLLHAVSATNSNILGEFIDYARSQGYRFELVTQ